MMRKLVRKVLWLGRGTATAMGIVVMLAVVLGAGTAALAAVPGDPFKLGRNNTIEALSRMVGTVNDAMLRIENKSAGASATALELRVKPGQPPMKVNSDAKVGELNADELDGQSAGTFLGTDEKAADAAHADRADQADNSDTVGGKSAGEIGVNGLEWSESSSVTNSDSFKVVIERCPAGKVLVGTGFEIDGGKSGTVPDAETDVVIGNVKPRSTLVSVSAYEEEPTNAEWEVIAYAGCAAAP